MRRARLCTVVLLALLPPVDGAAQQGSFRSSPPFHGESIPLAPQQSAPWSPPSTSLPDKFVDSIELLFEQGFADPRGCDYREIEVGTGSCWSGDGGVVSTRGWVLPASDDARQRFAVCWNGLVYPLVSVGKQRSYADDIREVISADEAARLKFKKEHPDREFHRWRRGVVSEAMAVSHKTPLPIKVLPLLRLGDVRLAEELYTAWHDTDVGEFAKLADDDPYLSLADDWAWVAFDRAVCAHMRGDDQLAIAAAAQLVPAWRAIEATAAQRGFELQQNNGDEEPYYLRYLTPITTLLVDQQRRDAATATEPAGKIEALIADLENVNARQWSQPGGVSLGMDARVRALVDVGNEAIEPLLECLENDTRLTRSVSFHRHFGQHRCLISVQEAAYFALERILKKSFRGPHAGGGYLSVQNAENRRQIASRIRSHLKRFQETPLIEQWYVTLADDSASPDDWLQAAGNIVASASRLGPSGPVRDGDWMVWRSDKSFAGKSLRDRVDPSVSELMAQRLANLSAQAAADSSNSRLVLEIRDFARHFARWDPDVAAPALSNQLRRSITLFNDARERGQSSTRMHYLAELIGVTATLAAHHGDTSVLEDYANWLQDCEPGELNDAVPEAFGPMWRFPREPAIQGAAEWLFGSEESPWNPIIQPGQRYNYVSELFETPLIALRPFREQALRMLEDQQVVGKVVATSETRFNIVQLNWSRGESTYSGDPLALKAGDEREIRLCDVYADELSHLPGSPCFAFYWPIENRDRAIREFSEFFRRYGANYASPNSSSMPARTSTWRDEKPQLVFDQLDAPATPQDVVDGKAIFSLGESRPTRVWELAKYPTPATWVARRSEFQPGAVVNSTSQGQLADRLHIRGCVWQAEEVLEDGGWRRYLGFTTEQRYGNGFRCGGIYKVPAEEVLLGHDDAELKLLLSPSWLVSTPAETRRKILRLGEPLSVTGRLQNQRAVAQPVPATFARPTASGVALLRGVGLHLHHQAATSPSAFEPIGGGEWTEISSIRPAERFDEGARETLQPTAETETFEFDVQEWFPIAKSGRYRLRMTFAPDDTTLPPVRSATIYFTIEDSRQGNEP